MLVLPHFFVSTAFKKMRWKDEFRKWLPKLPNNMVFILFIYFLLCQQGSSAALVACCWLYKAN